MHEIPVDHAALPALFDPAIPNNPVLWAVFRGRNGGRAWVDDLQSPSRCIVRTDAILTFASRQIGQAFLDRALAHLTSGGPVRLVWPSGASSRLQAPRAAAVVPRLEFDDCDPRSSLLVALRAYLPDELTIRPLDRDLLQRCEWRAEMEFYCGSVDNFLANGLGLCAMMGEEIVVEAYASSLGDARAEIGAITREAYRGRGYAPKTCAYLIQACERRGYRPYWSCDADNLASIRVARKLGFRREGAYQILAYKALPEGIGPG
jgi:RimJ/RimL family protein N-acetyltransferase